jgi:predicted homoserine dehydrogenase-like protein
LERQNMIIVDTELARRAADNSPIRVAISGAGFMGRHLTRQVATVIGMEVVGVMNRTEERAAENLVAAGYERIVNAADRETAERAIAAGECVVTTDPEVLSSADGVDVVLEATGTLEHGARVVLTALEHGKHVVLDNAELDASVGPYLQTVADRNGVVMTGIDGDEPAVAMNLVRFVRTIGLRPVLVGNIKGFLNHERNPDTQADFAARYGQTPSVIASFADGTKLAAECTVLANGVGFGVAKRGMNGYEMKDVSEVLDRFSPESLLERPLVEYALGAAPGSGVFVVGYEGDPERRAAMEYLKMGPGPLHLFTRPFHLPHLEAPLSAARAVIFGDAAIKPSGAPVCEVVAVAKRDLDPGETLDGVGGFTWYGLTENASSAAQDGVATMADVIDAVVTRPIQKGSAIPIASIEPKDGTLIADLRRRQKAAFPA